jgi:hypothetical protein
VFQSPGRDWRAAPSPSPSVASGDGTNVPRPIGRAVLTCRLTLHPARKLCPPLCRQEEGLFTATHANNLKGILWPRKSTQCPARQSRDQNRTPDHEAMLIVKAPISGVRFWLRLCRAGYSAYSAVKRSWSSEFLFAHFPWFAVKNLLRSLRLLRVESPYPCPSCPIRGEKRTVQSPRFPRRSEAMAGQANLVKKLLRSLR